MIPPNDKLTDLIFLLRIARPCLSGLWTAIQTPLQAPGRRVPIAVPDL
jgi:hypothetical protein